MRFNINGKIIEVQDEGVGKCADCEKIELLYSLKLRAHPKIKEVLLCARCYNAQVKG